MARDEGARSKSRRAFCWTFVGVLVGPDMTFAQASNPARGIGILDGGDPPTAEERQAALGPLRELGWIEGRNLVIQERYARGDEARLPALARELVALNVELIVSNGTAATIAAKAATRSIPIVMFSAGDPVRSGLVESLARPGGNITGYAVLAGEIERKRAALLHELLPAARVVGVVIDPSYPLSALLRVEIDTAYRSLSMRPVFGEVVAPDQIRRAVESLSRQKAQALVVTRTTLFTDHRAAVMTAALDNALPTIVQGEDELAAGGLISYSISFAEQYVRGAAFVDRILRGATPGDLPIEQPTRFELGVNLKTARALSIRVPETLLVRADRIIR